MIPSLSVDAVFPPKEGEDVDGDMMPFHEQIDALSPIFSNDHIDLWHWYSNCNRGVSLSEVQLHSASGAPQHYATPSDPRISTGDPIDLQPPSPCFACGQIIGDMERYLAICQQLFPYHRFPFPPTPFNNTFRTNLPPSTFPTSSAPYPAGQPFLSVGSGSGAGIWVPSTVSPRLAGPSPAMSASPNGLLPPSGPTPRGTIPQRRYRAPRPRHGPISGANFITFFMENGGGFPARDALNRYYVGLVQRDEAMVLNQGRASISVRILWPGYHSWSRQMKTTDWRSPPRSITRAKLATEIAKSLKLFMEKAETNPDEQTDQRWLVGEVGSNRISVDKVVLVSIERVSKSSWQPVFRLQD